MGLVSTPAPQGRCWLIYYPSPQSFWVPCGDISLDPFGRERVVKQDSVFHWGPEGRPSHTWQHMVGTQHSRHHVDGGQKAVHHHIPSERKATCGFWNTKCQALLLLQAKAQSSCTCLLTKNRPLRKRGLRMKQSDWTWSVTFYFIHYCFYEQLYDSDGDIGFKRIINVIRLTRELINHWHFSKKSHWNSITSLLA